MKQPYALDTFETLAEEAAQLPGLLRRAVIALLLTLCLCASVVTPAARAQSQVQSTYAPIVLPLGFSTMATNSTATLTNVVTTTTNTVTTVTYSQSSGAFVTNTTTTIYTNTVIPSANCTLSKDLCLQIAFQAYTNSGANVASTSNLVVTLNASVDGTNFGTTGGYTWTIPANGTNLVVATTNFSGLGYGYLQPTTFVWKETNAGVTLTNLSFTYSSKKLH